MINKVEIESFRGLKDIATELKRVNIVVGENGTDKTSFLEAIFLPALLQSDLSDIDVYSSFIYMLNSRGDTVSALLSLSDSKVTLDGVITQLKKIENFKFNVEINNEKVAEIELKQRIFTADSLLRPIYAPFVKLLKRVKSKYSPTYISTFLISQGLRKKSTV